MERSHPLLVLVGGAPASGKTTLVRRCAAELRLPLLTKDGIKEILGDTLGAADRPRSRELGAASYELLYAATGWLLDAGVGAIVESNFWRGTSEARLRPLTERARTVLIHCQTAPEEVLRRYRERGDRGERHHVHFDADEIPALRAALQAGRFEPLELLVPVLTVDTTSGYDPPIEAVLAFIRSAARD